MDVIPASYFIRDLCIQAAENMPGKLERCKSSKRLFSVFHPLESIPLSGTPDREADITTSSHKNDEHDLHKEPQP